MDRLMRFYGIALETNDLHTIWLFDLECAHAIKRPHDTSKFVGFDMKQHLLGE